MGAGEARVKAKLAKRVKRVATFILELESGMDIVSDWDDSSGILCSNRN